MLIDNIFKTNIFIYDNIILRFDDNFLFLLF